MFTIKFYSEDGCRQIIREADSFTILRCPPGPEDDGTAEITMHQKNGESSRIDVAPSIKASYPEGCPPRFAKAIIENSFGRTTEIIHLRPYANISSATAKPLGYESQGRASDKRPNPGAATAA